LGGGERRIVYHVLSRADRRFRVRVIFQKFSALDPGVLAVLMNTIFEATGIKKRLHLLSVAAFLFAKLSL
jgi:hypothetical protein